jgi:superfamily I DNA/RNA helicase
MSHSHTTEQRAFIEHENESVYVRACPGAGKTRTVVHRLKKQIDSQAIADRRGIAILSFTNSAVDEFKDRCAKAEIASELKYPNFVGTFDSFMWRFIFLPAIKPINGCRPRLVDSWNKNINLSGYKSIKGDGIALDMFDPVASKFKLTNEKNFINSVVTKYEQDYIQAAQKCLSSFNKKGLFSTNDMRQILVEKLKATDFSLRLGNILKGRFKEIIIDEAQDCNESDIFVIKWLKELGIHVIIVCDPDQAIYEFRNSTPEKLAELTSTFKMMRFTSNFRSAPNICQLASTLKKDLSIDKSMGEFREVIEPIRIIPYSGMAVCNSVGIRFLNIANTLGISTDKICSLAHDRSSAMRAAGINLLGNIGNSKRLRLAKAVVDFKNLAAPWHYRQKALLVIMQLILQCEGLLKDGDIFPQVIDENMIDERILRRRALEIINNLPDKCSENEIEAWIEQAKSSFENAVKFAPGVTVNQLFRSVDGWHKPLTQTRLSEQIILHSTIHEAKGREYLGVLLSIKPKSDVLDSWLAGASSEPLRVLYVGITRAKKLLGLGIHLNQLSKLQKILDNHSIPYQIHK